MDEMTFENSEERRLATGIMKWIEWAIEPDIIQDSVESDELKTFRRNLKCKIQSAIPNRNSRRPRNTSIACTIGMITLFGLKALVESYGV